MIYECDQCSKALPPGVIACPNCGETFEDTVPADAEVPRRGFSAVSSAAGAAPTGTVAPALQEQTPRGSGAGYDWLEPPAPTVQRSTPATSSWNQNISGKGMLTIVGLIVLGCIIFSAASNSDKTGSSASPSLAGAITAPDSAPQTTAASGSDTSTSDMSTSDTSTNAGSDSSGSSSANVPPLAKGSENFSRESDYDIVSGEITNTGSDKLDDVEAVTTFYDSNGGVVTTADAVIDFNPLMPGQTSPYKTMNPDNPLIKTEKTEFHSMNGPLLAYSDKSAASSASSAAHDDEASRDATSEVGGLGSGLSDRPIKRSILESRAVTEADMAGKSLAALSLSYNTIYAVHGYVFKRSSLKSAFEKLSWYHPNPGFAETDLTALESSNLKTIRDYERKEYHY